MKKTTNSNSDKKAPVVVRGFYSIAECAALSGVSAATMHRLVTSGKVRGIQPAGRGGKIVVPQGNLLTFLDERAAAAAARAAAARK